MSNPRVGSQTDKTLNVQRLKEDMGQHLPGELGDKQCELQSGILLAILVFGIKGGDHPSYIPIPIILTLMKT